MPNDLAALELRRFVTSSEMNEGTRLNEARIKALFGEDTTTATRFYGPLLSYQDF